MEAKLYNINNLKNRKMFYMLDNITDDSLQLFRRTPAGDEEFTSYDLHRMPDGKLLIAFYQYWAIQTVHSFVAVCGNEEEYVSATPYERIMPYLNRGIDYNLFGGFAFTNSKPIYTDVNDWRCDNTFYGPEKYLTTDGVLHYEVFKLEDIVVYEPIININGVSNLMFVYMKNENSHKNYNINEDVIPSCCISISEMFRLLTEWAALADEPFNSTQQISLDAKEFLNQIGFDNSLVADQVDMQVAEYIKGNTNARKRPDGIVETNQDLLDFIKRKMAHMSLASLLSCYPEYGSFDAEIQFDIESADQEFNDNLKQMGITGFYSFGMIDQAADLIPDNYANGKQVYTFKWGILKQKKELALSLIGR